MVELYEFDAVQVNPVADLVAHTWPDVVYLGLFIALTVFNALHNKAISKKADNVKIAVDDVKRATGITNRADDPDPVEPKSQQVPGHSVHGRSRRITDENDDV